MTTLNTMLPPALRGFEKEIKAFVCVVGIYFFYMLFAVYQERVTKIGYGEGDNVEKFRLFGILVLIQCATNSIVSGAILKFTSQSQPTQTVPIRGWLRLAGSYIGAMMASNTALKYINYPTQVLAKSCKMIPIMIMGLLLYRKTYSNKDYVAVGLITGGIVMFLLKPDKSEGSNGFGGLLLCFGSLVMDGFTGSYQDEIIKTHAPSSHQLMFHMNIWSSLLLFVYTMAMGEMSEALEFTTRHPEMLSDLWTLAFLGAMGQNFIFFTIRTFGALFCSVVTTTRKFFTILSSVLWFGHTLAAYQWLGVLTVFSGIGLNMHEKYVKSQKIQTMISKASEIDEEKGEKVEMADLAADKALK